MWGFIAFLAVIGIITAIGLFLFRPVTVAYYPFGFGFFPFGFFALFWIFGAFWVVRWLFFSWRGGYSPRYWGAGGSYGDRAYYILRERYARGEISKEQFEQMMRDLQQHQQVA